MCIRDRSRLNRTYPGKEGTFILDFVNDAEDIQAAFQPYYEKTMVGDRVDYKQLYELQAKLDSYQVFCNAEVEELSLIHI